MADVKILEEGTNGTVHLYSHKGNDGNILDVAVKTSDVLNAASLQTEIEILSKFKYSPRIVQVYFDKLVEDIDNKGNKFYSMFMEYAPKGSLLSLMESYKDMKLPDPMVREFTCMLLEGLASIHDLGYVHCDLEPENILVFPSNTSSCRFEVKISDFGLTRREGDDKWWTPSSPYVGTAAYMSPESVVYGKTEKALDLWSLGCIVLEMCTGDHPWMHIKAFDLENLENCYKPRFLTDLPVDAKHFIDTCLLVNTEGRGSALKLLDHDFVRAYVSKEMKEKNQTKEVNENILH